MLMEQPNGQTGAGDVQIIDNNSIGYQTASKILKNISKGSTQDIVILYENIDSDTNEASGTDPKPMPSNQYVETIVYNDDTDSECSDVSEIYTKEDFHELCMINNETIDFINNIPSIENPLCHKHSSIKLKSSEFAREKRKQFFIENPYNDYQFKSFNIFGSTLPTSLVDYRSWKPLDDDYNFYMDNLISYVQYTIEQLKRISNGEYLTDKAKQKWRETKIFENKEREHVNNTVVSNTICNPLRPYNKNESCNINNKKTTNSEINLIFLNKILEKKCVLEIPKFIGGSFTLFGKMCDNKLIIQCNKGKQSNKKEEESQMLVALDLKYPNLPLTSGNSKLALQTFSNPKGEELCKNKLLALEHKNATHCCSNKSGSKLSIVELEDEDIQNKEVQLDVGNETIDEKTVSNCDIEGNADSNLDKTNFDLVSHISKINNEKFCESHSYKREELYASEEKFIFKDNNNTNTLSCAVQRLNTRSPVHEEAEKSIKKKNRSPTRVRIKSPYENKSYILDEKKRKRLLEIRERREKRKIAMSKNCKISKNKFGQGSIFPQASSSVTKLSITNKSFYNSIYGHSIYTESKEVKQNPKKRKKNCDLSQDTESYMENLGSNSSILSSSEDNPLTYFKSPETEQYTKEESINMDTNDKGVKLDACTMSRIIVQGDNVIPNSQQKQLHFKELDKNEINFNQPRCVENLVSANTQVNVHTQESPKVLLSLECRKSIDKLYDLMKELGKPNSMERRTIKSDSMSSSVETLNICKSENSIVSSVSLNGSNIKYQNISSSFVKRIETSSPKNNKYNVEANTNIAKASVTSKPQTTVKFDEQNIKNHRKHVTSKQFTPNHISDNPIKAISQLIHKFDNVQRLNQKSGYEIKVNKKLEDTNKEDKNNTFRLVSSKISKPDKLLKNNNNTKDNRILTPKDKKSPVTKEQPQKVFNRFKSLEFKNTEKSNEKKIEDLIDEVKEMRGEAVRGPKQTRLDALAQPKKLRFDPLNKENGVNYGRNSLGNRLHRNSLIPQRVINVAFQNNKSKKTLDSKSSQLPIIKSKTQEEAVTNRRSASNSPERIRLPEKKKLTQSNVNNSILLKKKPVVDETKQFGQISINLKDCTRLAQKSRVPLIPDDFTNVRLASQTSLLSTIDSNSIGKKINCMVSATPSPCLNDLKECDESSSLSLFQLSKSDKTEAFESKSYDNLSVSDYQIDIFEDKYIETAVASTSYSKHVNDESSIQNKESNQLVKFSERTSSSLSELEKLENTLTGHNAGDTFHNKLKKQNMTSVHSMQQIFVLQSGDAGSLVVQSAISQKLSMSNKDLRPKILSLESWSKSFIDCCKLIPVQCFPVLQSMQYCDPVRNLIQKSYNDSISNFTSKTSGKDLTENSQKLEIYYDTNKEYNKKDESIIDILSSLDNKKYNNDVPSNNKDIIVSNHFKSEIDPNLVDINRTEVNEHVENVSNTTSMDILVGLLNEIKNISAYQSNIENQCMEENHEGNRNIKHENSLENNYQNHISITELDKLRKLESNSSMYSYFNSSNDDLTNDLSELIMNTVNANEESIYSMANTAEKQIVHRCTNVPSKLLPITVHKSTTICTSVATNVVGEESGGSGQRVTNAWCDKGCFVTCSNSSFNTVSTNVIFDLKEQTKLQNLNKTSDKTVIVKEYDSEKEIISAKNKFIKCSNVESKTNNIKDEAIDSQLKLKRDILVTVYSMLVLTVFVALTFPNIFFN